MHGSGGFFVKIDMLNTSRGVVLSTPDGELKVKDFALPKLRLGDVLVRMEVSAMNAVDMMYIKGLYPVVKDLPTVPGFEGAGTVIATGNGPSTWGLQGKRVAVLATDPRLPGTWAQFTVTPAALCVTLRDDVSFEAGACLFVNPLTVCMFEEQVVKGKFPAIILTAAASAIGRMMLKACKKTAVICVCVVEKESHKEKLRSLGAEHILLSDDPHFGSKLASYCEELNITCAFDAVGGDVACKVLNSMRDGGILYSYSAIDPNPVLNHISFQGLIFQRKKIVGLTLFPWLETKNFIEKHTFMKKIQGNLDVYGTEISMEFLLEDAEEAILYHRKFKSRGKVMFRMRTVYQSPALPGMAVTVEPEVKKEEVSLGNKLKAKFMETVLKLKWRKTPEIKKADPLEIELKDVYVARPSETQSTDLGASLAVLKSETQHQKDDIMEDSEAERLQTFRKFWDPMRQANAGPVPDYTASFKEEQDSDSGEGSFLCVKRV